MNAVLTFIGDIASIPFSFLLNLFYTISNNYIISIMLITILVKLCFLPFAVKDRKSGVRQRIINTEIKKIAEQYTDNEETAKAKIEEYKKQHPNKKGSGCLINLLQFIVLIGAFRAISTPLTSVFRLGTETIESMKSILTEAIGKDVGYIEMAIIQNFENLKETFLSKGVLTDTQISDISSFTENFTFFGLDLTTKPDITNITSIIPFIVLVLSMCSVVYSIIRKRRAYPERRNLKCAILDSTGFVTPVIMYIFTFMFPTAVGLYWIFSNFIALIQKIIVCNVYTYEKAIAKKEQGENNG